MGDKYYQEMSSLGLDLTSLRASLLPHTEGKEVLVAEGGLNTIPENPAFSSPQEKQPFVGQAMLWSRGIPELFHTSRAPFAAVFTKWWLSNPVSADTAALQVKHEPTDPICGVGSAVRQGCSCTMQRWRGSQLQE